MAELKGRDDNLTKRTRFRKVTGWVIGSIGVITIILSIFTIILLGIGIYLIFELAKELDPANMMGGAILGCSLYMSIAGIILFILIGIFQILKVISGILIHKAKGQVVLIIIMTFGLGSSFTFIFLNSVTTLLIFPYLGAALILLGILDMILWGLMIWVLVFTWKTFPDQRTIKKRSRDQSVH
jgi:hypothetical protein